MARRLAFQQEEHGSLPRAKDEEDASISPQSRGFWAFWISSSAPSPFSITFSISWITTVAIPRVVVVPIADEITRLALLLVAPLSCLQGKKLGTLELLRILVSCMRRTE
ncbi:hypothetical protein BDZ97DRAFT_1923352 [Flammula alnicola]|nr:hypothetical protein BDZ97DRAFT_1923352 [Flammula alnicola]